MKNIKKHTQLGKLLLVTLLILSSSLFMSCDDDKDDKDGEQKQYLIGQLTQAKDGLEYLIDYSDFGYKQGQYPIESKDLLTGDFDELTELIEDLNNKAYSLSEVEAKVDAAVAQSTASIEAFKATKRTETIYDQDTIDKLTILQNKKIELLDLRDNTTYGRYAGQYPTDSKSILQTGIDDLSDVIEQIENFEIVNPSRSVIDTAVAAANTSVNEFRSTVRIVDDIIYKLLVDGNAGGYIDFGYSEDYIKFGDQGSQSFTIEMWVNIKDYCSLKGEDNSTFLSTYTQKDTPQVFTSGWRVQSRNKNIIRGSVGIIDVNNNARYGWEPSFSFSKQDEWVHVAYVYSDTGLDGVADYRNFIYCNGVCSTDKIRIGEKERQYNSAGAMSANMKMTAFGRVDYDGITMKEYFTGYIKKMRIWKTAKDASYIVSSKNGAATIDSSDPDLVCAWDFETKPVDGVTITDLTGRHTAVIKGSHQWIEAE